MEDSVSELGAMGLAFGAYTFWVFADTCLKFAGSSRMSAYEMLAVVGLAEIVFLMGYAVWRGDVRELRPRSPGKQCLRSLLDVANNLGVIVAVRHVPLALFYILVFFAPLVTVLLAAVVLSEPVDLRRGLAIVIGFGGVVVAVHPSRTGWQPGYGWGYLACVVCVLCFSANAVLSRKLVRKETLASMIFVSGVVTFVVCAALTAGRIVAVTPGVTLALGGTALFGVAGSVCFFLAVRHTATANVVPFHYTQLVTGAALAYAIWHERPTGWMLVGAAVIVGMGFLTASMGREASAVT